MLNCFTHGTQWYTRTCNIRTLRTPPAEAVRHLFQWLSICLWKGNATLWASHLPPTQPGLMGKLRVISIFLLFYFVLFRYFAVFFVSHKREYLHQQIDPIVTIYTISAKCSAMYGNLAYITDSDYYAICESSCVLILMLVIISRLIKNFYSFNQKYYYLTTLHFVPYGKQYVYTCQATVIVLGLTAVTLTPVTLGKTT